MRKDYDLTKLKVKRRGVMAGLSKTASPTKLRVTMLLDEDIVALFKTLANEPHALPYQTQINKALREVMTRPQYSVQQALLQDKKFIAKLAQVIKQGA